MRDKETMLLCAESVDDMRYLICEKCIFCALVSFTGVPIYGIEMILYQQ